MLFATALSRRSTPWLLQHCILKFPRVPVQAGLRSMAKGVPYMPPMAQQHLPSSGQGPDTCQLSAHRLVHPGTSRYLHNSHARL